MLAQQRNLDLPPPDSDYIQPESETAVPIAATAFAMPDLPDRAQDRTTYDGRRFSARFSVVGLIDYNAFVQDADNRQRRWGAWELVGRYSHVDIVDRLVNGGIFDRETLGLNWWATRRWKLGLDYGRMALDRGGLTGTTRAVHARLHRVY